MMIAEILILALILVLSIPVVVIFLQTVFALFPQRSTTLMPGPKPLVAIIIPAHNEAMLIEQTLQSLMPQMHEGDRVLVIADNCTDDTAALARKAGAEAIERSDMIHRGKGYALDYGVRHLQKNPPEILMIVDADCQAGDGLVSKLAACCVQSGRPVQSLYLMRSPQGASLKTRIAEFAWLFKNKIRPSGWHRIDMPCHLMGSGMAFPWQVIGQAKLASGHIVEDLKLGIDLALVGYAPFFLQEAVVTSYFPGNNAGLESQRARWEHGHIGVILKEGPKLLVQATRKLDVRLLAMALDLMVPPLALQTLLTFLAVLASLLIYWLTGNNTILLAALTVFALMGVTIFTAWAVYGRSVISFGSLCYAPIYALVKIPLYIRYIFKRQVEWVRSRRDESNE